MTLTVGIVAPGNMGAAVARRLVENGVRVLTSVVGRSAASAERARAAGMVAVELGELATAEIVLSILPPGQATEFARRIAPSLGGASRVARPVFVDCNAVSPETVREIAAVFAGTGVPFVDGSIIGLPPREGQPSPHFYISGETRATARVEVLGQHGLDVRVLDGPVGAASALKMCYAGINKGLAAIAAAMILAAERSGAAAALYQEMSESLPGLLRSLERQVPDMLPKAYRWVAAISRISATQR